MLQQNDSSAMEKKKMSREKKVKLFGCLIPLLSIVLIILIVATASAIRKKLDKNVYYTKYSRDGWEFYEVTQVGQNVDKNLVIPSTYEGLPVTGIGSHCQFDKTKVESVTLPNTITEIGKEAFLNCSTLKQVTIDGNHSLEIGQEAFANCGMLEQVTIENGDSLEIHQKAFYNCTSLTNIQWKNVKTLVIESEAFSGCGNFTNVEWGDRKIYVATDAFDKDTGVISEYSNAFYIGNSQNPYYKLIAVTDKSITSCQVHKDAKVIGENAFYGCKNIVTIDIPEGVEVIESRAFGECPALDEITIPKSVMTMGVRVFEGNSMTILVQHAKFPEGWNKECFNYRRMGGSIQVQSEAGALVKKAIQKEIKLLKEKSTLIINEADRLDSQGFDAQKRAQQYLSDATRHNQLIEQAQEYWDQAAEKRKEAEKLKSEISRLEYGMENILSDVWQEYAGKDLSEES